MNTSAQEVSDIMQSLSEKEEKVLLRSTANGCISATALPVRSVGVQVGVASELNDLSTYQIMFTSLNFLGVTSF